MIPGPLSRGLAGGLRKGLARHPLIQAALLAARMLQNANQQQPLVPGPDVFEIIAPWEIYCDSRHIGPPDYRAMMGGGCGSWSNNADPPPPAQTGPVWNGHSFHLRWYQDYLFYKMASATVWQNFKVLTLRTPRNNPGPGKVWTDAEVPAMRPGFLQPLAPDPDADPQPMVQPFFQTRPKVGVGLAFRPLPYGLLPGRGTHPGLSPDEQTQRGPAAGPGDPTPPPNAPFTPKRPPGRGTKERKLRLLGGGPVRNAIEAAFETAEVGECLANSAGAPSGPTQERLRWTYRNADKIDGCKFVECLLNNEIEDRVFGAAGRAARAGARSGGRPYGTGSYTGPARSHWDLEVPKISLGCGGDKDLPDLGDLGIA